MYIFIYPSMSIINTRKKTSFTPIIRNEYQKLCKTNPISNNICISLILTESTASILNIRAKHLQEIKENEEKSKICLVVQNLQKKNTPGGNEHLIINDNLAYFRILQMEESSTSVYAMDDLSETRLKPKNDSRKEVFYLGPQFVNTNSLMTVQSIAHNSNLISEENNIFIHVNYNNLPITSSDWINMCRICHCGDSCEDLIGPCRCKGSVALAHLSCLERWLRESEKSYCELCQHHYKIKRTPKYNIFKSIFVWLLTSDEHRHEVLSDFIAFCLYTPAAVCSTYILTIICECAVRNSMVQTQYPAAHLIAFFSIAGMAAIDFTYSSWLMMHFHKHMQAWRTWYKENCFLTLLLPPRKLRKRVGITCDQTTTSVDGD